MGVTNRGSCASSQSSGSPLVLGNQKLREEALLVWRKNRYLCTVEVKPVPPIPAFGRSLFVYSYFRFRGLQTPLPVAVSGLYRPQLRFRRCLPFAVGSGERGLGVIVYACLHKMISFKPNQYSYRGNEYLCV
jgi:hypothetical protein